LTFGEYDEHSIDWSPDGTEIAFVSNRAPDPDDVHGNDLWAVSVEDGTVRRLTDTPGPEFGPEFSPDGRWIAYTAGVRPVNTRDSPMENDQLWVMPAAGGAANNLSTVLDRRVRDFQWSGDSRLLFFRAENEGSVHLYRVSVGGGPVHSVITDEGEITDFVVSPTLDRIAYRMVARDKAPDIYATSQDGSWRKQLTDLQEPFYENVTFSRAEPFWYESFDGTRVQAWLAKPNPFSEGQTYPLVLMIHGGPHGAYRHNIDWITQVFAEAGYGVLRINPRGSVGYGQEFADGTLNDWGGGDYRDLMAGVDYVVANSAWVDGERLGVWGYSYGGYMTNWIVTQTDRFKAAVSGGSLSNLISFYGTSLYHLLVETEFPGEVWENHDLLWDRSPLKHVANVETPVLLVHGEIDHDVPVTQAEEMFVALKKLGVDTEFVRYPGMGHGFNSGEAMDDFFRRMMEWYDRYLKEGT
jgi:dipeptidyl aminopeptidase/acylaminoacyl peptidase